MTHPALPHLETAEMLEDHGNKKGSMHIDVEVTLKDANQKKKCHMDTLVLRANEKERAGFDDMKGG